MYGRGRPPLHLADCGEKEKPQRTCGCATSARQTRLVLVVLVLVDAPADVVLAAIQLALFGLGQMAVVLRHIGLLLLLHAGLTFLKIGGFLRTQ